MAENRDNKATELWVLAVLTAVTLLVLYVTLMRPAFWNSGRPPAGGHVMSGKERTLESLASFCFRATSGRFTIFDLRGRIIADEQLSDMQDCNLRFVVLDSERGMVIGNAGTGHVTVRKTNSSISLIESTGGGTEHVLTINDSWSPREHGFHCTYVRTVNNPLLSEMLRSVYSGFACPDV